MEGVEWPGGWPGEIEAAVIDAVFSIRARYGSRTSGVRAVVARWRDHRNDGNLNDLGNLASFETDPDGILNILDNKQKLYGGMLKAQGCAVVAQRLLDKGVQTSGDIADRAELRGAWNSVAGLGNVTWSYMLMLLGHQDVKADVMIQRFVGLAFADHRIDTRVDSKLARAVVIAAAGELSSDGTLVEPTTLDHGIWQHQRRR